MEHADVLLSGGCNSHPIAVSRQAGMDWAALQPAVPTGKTGVQPLVFKRICKVPSLIRVFANKELQPACSLVPVTLLFYHSHQCSPSAPPVPFNLISEAVTQLLESLDNIFHQDNVPLHLLFLLTKGTTQDNFYRVPWTPYLCHVTGNEHHWMFVGYSFLTSYNHLEAAIYYRSYYHADQGKALNTTLTPNLTSATENVTNKLSDNTTEVEKTILTHSYELFFLPLPPLQTPLPYFNCKDFPIAKAANKNIFNGIIDSEAYFLCKS